MALKRTVQAAGGRQLSTQVTGDPDGHPVFLLHGTPGSRLGPRPASAVLRQLGVQLISFDRPGYGESERLKGRTVADAASDVLAIADAYGLEKFAVVGRSGGGPHALACAALLPDRTAQVAVLVGMAPRGAEDLDWLGGMTPSNVAEHQAAASSYDEIVAHTGELAGAVRDDPASLIRRLEAELPESDKRVVAELGIRTQLVETYAEGLRASDYGWIDDALAFSAPWGFDVAAVTVPILLWHGADDVFSPVGHSRWLADRIPGAQLVVQAGAGHFGAFEVMPEILQWAVA
jgi:pimeloyl-ACP methyl ester carboxylesterase